MAKRKRNHGPSVNKNAEKAKMNARQQQSRSREEAIKNRSGNIRSIEWLNNQMKEASNKIEEMNSHYSEHLIEPQDKKHFDRLFEFRLSKLLNIVYIIMFESIDEWYKKNNQDPRPFHYIIMDVLEIKN